jgi:hypothetical protein
VRKHAPKWRGNQWVINQPAAKFYKWLMPSGFDTPTGANDPVKKIPSESLGFLKNGPEILIWQVAAEQQ